MKEIISFAAGAAIAGALMFVYGAKVKANVIAEVGVLKKELIVEFQNVVQAIKSKLP